MTKKELKAAMEDYIARQGIGKDEWYCSDRDLAQCVLENFASDLGITLEDPEGNTDE